MVTTPFYAYVKDLSKSNYADKPVFFDEPLLIFAMFNAINGLNFVYEYKGQVKSVTSTDILFSHLQGEKCNKVVVLIGKSAFAISKEEAIEKGYMIIEEADDEEEEIEIEEEEVEDEEIIESKPSTNTRQKSKRSVRKPNKKK